MNESGTRFNYNGYIFLVLNISKITFKLVLIAKV
jgi:hypothetical protein